MPQVTPRKLEVFAAVVEHGGCGAAAAALELAQPSVSTHIHALEDPVGATLIERLLGHTTRLRFGAQSSGAEMLGEAGVPPLNIRSQAEAMSVLRAGRPGYLPGALTQCAEGSGGGDAR